MATADDGTRGIRDQGTRGQDTRDRSFLGEVKDAISGRAALLMIGVLALTALFIASYAGAFHSPKPKDVPLAVVAPQQMSGQLVERLGKLPGSPLDPRTASSEADAARQIKERDIDGALIVDPRGTTDKLLVAGGSGASLSQAVEQVVTQAEKAQQRTVQVQDIAPADKDDTRGLSSFYLVVGWCVGGYLCAAILAISFGARPVNLKRAVIRLAALAVYSVLTGLAGAVVIGPVLGAMPGSLYGLWGLGALIVFAVGATTFAFQAIAGIIGIGLTILVVVIAGNPSAGGAYPYPLLPDFWRAIGPALPPGAGTWVARSIAYFHGNAVTGPLLVLSAWAVAGTALTLLFSALTKGRTVINRSEVRQ
ncbi:ABC transporter permease [Streptomyces chrestomyceticus]|uniref:ABC transporter permease n=1 Tax=Streptomyces chrestomyceticus TaxID=68185 RepID=UPI0037A0E105